MCGRGPEPRPLSTCSLHVEMRPCTRSSDCEAVSRSTPASEQAVVHARGLRFVGGAAGMAGSRVGVGDGRSSPCPGHRSSREGARNDDPRIVVANSSLNALGEVPGGSGNRPEVLIGQEVVSLSPSGAA